MSKDDNSKILNSIRGITDLLRRREPSIVTKASKGKTPSSYTIQNTYSAAELARLPGGARSETTNEFRNSSILQAFVKTITSGTADDVQVNKILAAINPEIKKAKQIYTSCVMSPNDMQQDLVSVVFDNEKYDDALIKDINTLLTDFFNEQMNLGSKLTEWIGEYTYETNSKPVLVLPRVNIKALLNNADKIDHTRGRIFNESDGDSVITLEDYCPEDIPIHKISVEDFDWSNLTPSFESDSLLAPYVHLESDEKIMDRILTEALVINKPIVTASGTTVSNKTIRDVTKNIVKQLKGSSITLTSDIQQIAKTKVAKEVGKTIKEKDIFLRMDSLFDGSGMNILSLVDTDSPMNTYAMWMELPSDAVVPIVFPGDRKNPHGYIVALDHLLNPVSMFRNMNAFNDEKREMNVGSAVAMFGVGTDIHSHQKPEQRYEMIEAIFTTVMSNLLKDQAEKNTLFELDHAKYETISKCLFLQMLNKHRVNLVYVPASLMVYYCDDYNEDGTGKSKLSDVQFIFTIKTILLVAQVMGTTRACIDVDTADVTFDDKDVDYEQTLELVRQIIASRKTLDFNNPNPTSITNNLAMASVRVRPRNIPGLEFEVEQSKGDHNNDFRVPDTELLDIINNMTTEHLGVPSSSLDQTKEMEFATAFTTQHLLFSNDIRKVHRDLAVKNKKLVTATIRYSKHLQRDLLLIFRKFNSEHTATIEELSSKPFTKMDLDFLRDLMEDVAVLLPEPKVSVTSAQSEALEKELTLIEKLLEILYNEELISHEDGAVAEYLKVLAAHAKRNVVTDIIQNSTFHKTLSLPSAEEMSTEGITRFIQAIVNKSTGTKEHFAKMTERQEAEPESEEDSSSTWD